VEINTMMSPKLAVLMTTLALVGAVSPVLASATNGDHEDDPSNSVSVERNNEIEQSNDIAQYACTNDQDNEAENEGGDQIAVIGAGDQSNDCTVTQGAEARNDAAIVDASTNDIAAILANVNVDDSILAGLGL
jgi:hypothetical protein